MESLYDKMMNCNKNNKILYINTDFIIKNNNTKVIRDFILYSIKNGEKTFIFTDDFLYTDLKLVFNNKYNIIKDYLNKNILSIRFYSKSNVLDDLNKFYKILEEEIKYRNKINIIWDFKNLSRYINKMKKINMYISKLNFNDEGKIRNLVYVNNYCNLNMFEDLYMEFESIIVLDRDKELYFDGNEDLSKTLWLLNSNAQLRYQNENLLSFNSTFSNMPKTYNKAEFTQLVMKKLKEICNIDFCIMYSKNKLKENVLGLDSYLGITKKHKYYIMNHRNLILYQKSINKDTLVKETSKYIDFTKIEDKELKTILLQELDIYSVITIYVEYYDLTKGVISIGRYGHNRRMIKEELRHLNSICKSAFCIIQEQNKFFELQNKFIESEKLRAMGEMAAGIAHDVNNVLTPIVGSIQLLKDNNEKDKNLIKQLEVIEICAYDGMNITNKIKRFTKKYNLNYGLETFNIDNIIRDSINLTKNKWLTESALNGININVISKLNSNAKVKGNETEIREVFINIIKNAIDAISEEGYIEVTSQVKKNNVIIEFRDNGVGMNREVIKRAFEPFFTTKGKKGSGLGLSVSYKIIQDHGGTMKIESKEDFGTVFYIELPICDYIKDINFNKKNVKVNFQGNVLVVDDQYEVRKIISDMIKSITKAKVKICDNSNIKNEIKKRNYDIIICDFSMPGLNGIQISNIAKNINKDIFFCLMTGWLGDFDENMIKNIDHILNKPINLDKLKNIFITYENYRYK
ncbi:hybrid sensor histidine kinase/response regulator [Clostridium cochlearium]|uniref:Stage 0 sporulation protein A homolog n=2 Tax=Clostridium cochlearium TaxID=1494 RepID=A0A239YVU7_CLOCO|nr:hybrid sensor histidine kinase/response regulator [Clostridium cochlearium]MBE6066008.1 hybrid sensor histidine kinase/response regulator [Clostridium cochlearium]MBU5270381.1 hybrid sensor histidine kinase/response regulator [Clostridium cochlearium]MCR1972477.1 hybrid sensor histidine kinase/response regulator [Clostridium cochlearium]NOH16921.1 hybrid sensor histidine kinase/response regulator [Clostridium cochlearium]SDL32632.1 His Kinase A (phospho-acceptor) domain-containing protein [